MDNPRPQLSDPFISARGFAAWHGLSVPVQECVGLPDHSPNAEITISETSGEAHSSPPAAGLSGGSLQGPRLSGPSRAARRELRQALRQEVVLSSGTAPGLLLVQRSSPGPWGLAAAGRSEPEIAAPEGPVLGWLFVQILDLTWSSLSPQSRPQFPWLGARRAYYIHHLIQSSWPQPQWHYCNAHLTDKDPEAHRA